LWDHQPVRWTIPLGRLLGIRIELHVTFLLFVGWIALEQGLLRGEFAAALAAVALLLLVFACVLLHELGHAMAARRYGIQTRDIILLPIGGVARLTRMPEKPQQEIVVALAGPAVNVLIAALLALVLFGTGQPVALPTLRGGLVEALLFVNVWMVLFNLIPAFPMDGGRVLRALIALRLPYARATRIAAGVGQGIAVVFGLVGLAAHLPMLLFVALFVFLAAADERAMVQARAALAGVSVQAAMLTDFRRLDAHDSLRRAADYLMTGSQQDFPVLDGDRLVGVLTRDDLIRGIQIHGDGLAVADALRHNGLAAAASEPLDVAVARMRAQGRSALPVIEDGRLVGLLTLENIGELLLVRDALRRFAGRGRAA
jgi:Zn-dependent protease/CBS domain-containing protein